MRWEAAGQLVVLLTDLLARRCGTGEMRRNTEDGKPPRQAGQAGRTCNNANPALAVNLTRSGNRLGACQVIKNSAPAPPLVTGRGTSRTEPASISRVRPCSPSAITAPSSRPTARQAPCGGLAPRLRMRLLGYRERVLVVGLRAGDAEVAREVAEDLGHGPQGNQHRVGSGGTGGEGQQRLVVGFGARGVVKSDGEQAADAGLEQPAAVPAYRAEGGGHRPRLGGAVGSDQPERVQLGE